MDAVTALEEADRRLVRTVDALADEQYAEPSGLPGWTRAHVLAHLALNAEALAAALGGVVARKPVPMYPSQEARDADVEALAQADPADIRARVLGSTTRLADALAAVPEGAGEVLVERVPGGPTFAARDVGWMRLREVEIHHADLDAGYDHRAWHPDFATHVLEADAVTARLATGSGAERFTAHASDLGRSWTFGVGGPVVSGAAVDLAWWLTGRGTGEGLTSEGGDLPRIGAW